MNAIHEALQGVKKQISQVADQCGRSSHDILLLAVSKTFPVEAVEAAFDAGQRAFGENYVQELATKSTALAHLPIEWHFIGPLQSNKTKIVAEHAHWMHSVDRLKIAERLSDQRPAHLPPLNICLQVNISGEASKSGITPSEVMTLASEITKLPNLILRGLMCIPAPAATHDAQRAPFAALRELLQQMQSEGLAVDTLSMGMSSDMAAAIEEGATIVRVGTAIFGSRNYS
ncbi:YggS family pyridoxal phosphate-dependent enzyme [Leeia sp. TBRC 13508]|uniref:Pyridoxal phosphate homeostasis protein n=1 Tax=Leeia speluncae TaxID=2884804 RepID=A0ABS8D478_9NEIS|nr:YggS family pyridoxal phosphate-dependent enzyme [Leeia speluncae]MCB6183000.1 YggS family pyridoxal phosphate-dependent enzyme [Leeia speluncae]